MFPFINSLIRQNAILFYARNQVVSSDCGSSVGVKPLARYNHPSLREYIFSTLSCSNGGGVGSKIDCNFLRSLLLAVCLCLIVGAESNAQARRPIKGRSVKTPVDLSLYDFNFGSEVNKLFVTSADTDLNDPITIASLRQLKDSAQPEHGIFTEDIDPSEARRAVRKAFAMQSSRSIVRQINESEIRSDYEMLKSEFDSILSLLRYSVQDDGDTVSFRREDRGKKLVELSFEINVAKGVDPQIRFGENIRIRYDYMENVPTLEYFGSF